MALLRAPLVRGLILGLIGFGIGVAITGAIRTSFGLSWWDTNASWFGGYPVALFMWIMGVGGWEHWAREWFGLEAKPYVLTGWKRYFGFSGDHKVIGIQYAVTLAIVFLLAGLFALAMRLELAQPGMQYMSMDVFNATMSFHGIVMLAVALAATSGGFGNYFVPLMLGARDMAFPRLNALTFWLVPPVALTLVIAVLMGGWDSGWTAYPPLSVINKPGQTLFNLAVITFGLVSILGGINFIVTIIYERAPGMTWFRMPIFVWGVFSASLISFFFTQALAVALLMVLLERVFGTSFFKIANGGNPILYQHVFWFYSHPAVYVMVLPGFGMSLEVLAHMSRKPLYGYKWVTGAFLGIVVLSGVVWAHHMFTSGMNPNLHGPFLLLTELISIPTGLVFLAAIGTIWAGKMWVRTPMLFALSFIFNFLIGGVTGIYLADVPTDLHLQDTYFVVAHFHYTVMGGAIFTMFAGLYYWFPKMTGRMFNERLGQIHFWLMFSGFQITFIPLFRSGVLGQNRRIADYPGAYGDMNMLATIGSLVLGASFIFFVWNIAVSWVKGEKASDNPWGATTLEWSTSSPPSEHNFDEIPTITDEPYPYGRPGRVTRGPAIAGGTFDEEGK